jgi:hypothetical protein
MSHPVTSENTTAETQGQGCIAPGRFYPCPDLPEPVPASAAPAGTEPVPPERNGTVMNHSHATGQQRRAEELVSWTCGERIRFLWYRFCLTVQEMAYANGQMTAFQMGLTPPDSAPLAARGQERR